MSEANTKFIFSGWSVRFNEKFLLTTYQEHSMRIHNQAVSTWSETAVMLNELADFAWLLQKKAIWVSKTHSAYENLQREVRIILGDRMSGTFVTLQTARLDPAQRWLGRLGLAFRKRVGLCSIYWLSLSHVIFSQSLFWMRQFLVPTRRVCDHSNSKIVQTALHAPY